MLIYDSNQKVSNPSDTKAMEDYLKGVFDDGEFKEEDHPRGGKGSEGGGRFVKSEKTKKKEDEVDDLGSSPEKGGDSQSGIDVDDLDKRQTSLMDKMSEWDDNNTFAKKLGADGDKAYREISLVRGRATDNFHAKNYAEAEKHTKRWESMMNDVEQGKMPK